jgi:succinate dehydrogenase / fumarate reductase, membrane anchor subunit
MATVATTTEAGRVRPLTSSNFELYSWYFFRVSGVLLIFLALGHVVMVHIINNVDMIDYNWVAGRWRSPAWRLYDWFLLMLALLHGLNGLRVILDDYVHHRAWRTVAMSALWVVGAALLVIGTEVIVTFQPAVR